MNLALSDLQATSLDELIEELRGHGVRVEAVPADLTDRKQLEALVGRAEEAIGPLDILVNNAGLEFGGSYLPHHADELEAILDVNLLAMMVLTREALPGMLERGRGHIVNMASLAGKMPDAVPGLLLRDQARRGRLHARAARGVWGEPVGFSAICPGFVSRVGMYGRLEQQVPATPRDSEPCRPSASARRWCERSARTCPR